MKRTTVYFFNFLETVQIRIRFIVWFCMSNSCRLNVPWRTQVFVFNVQSPDQKTNGLRFGQISNVPRVQAMMGLVDQISNQP